MYNVSLDAVTLIALAPFVLIPAMLAIFAVLETAGRIYGWFIVQRFRLAANNINTTEAFAEVMGLIAEEIDMTSAVFASTPLVDNCCRILPTLGVVDAEDDAKYEDVFPGKRNPCGVHPVVTPNMLRPIDPATKARAVEDFDDTCKTRAIQYPTPLQKLRSNPFYFDSSMLTVGHLVSGDITIR